MRPRTVCNYIHARSVSQASSSMIVIILSSRSERVIDLALPARHVLGHGVLVIVEEAFEEVEVEQIGVGARQQEAPDAPGILAAQPGLPNAMHETPEEHDCGDGVARLALQPVQGMPLPVLD